MTKTNMRHQLKLEEAKIKLKVILKNAKALGLSEIDVIDKMTALRLKTPWATRWRLSLPKICFISFTGILFMVIYGLNLHRAAVNVYFDWKHQTTNPDQCAVAVPDAFHRIFRPPVDCSVCRTVSEVEVVKNLPVSIFEERYAYSGRPVVIVDGTANWSAPSVFSFQFFRELYGERLNLRQSQCQFFPYQTSFRHLGEFLNMTNEELNEKAPWYVGWSNCDVEITDVLRQHYHRPYFLPPHAEGKRLDWIFMGSKGFGAPMHVDNVEFPSWQAQLKGEKKWILQPPPECFYECTTLEVIVQPGEIIVLDTNQWYHQTLIVSQEISITIGAEFD